MKDSKFGQFLKKNGAVIISISGIFVIAIAVMLIVNGSIKESESNPEQEYHIDLNEMAEGDNAEGSSQLALGESEEQDKNQPAPGAAMGEGQAQNAQADGNSDGTQVADNNAQTGEKEADGVADVSEGDGNKAGSSELTAESQPISNMPPAEVAENTGTEEPEFVDEVQEASSSGSSVEQKDAVDLFFEEGMGLTWPVDGNVVLSYSNDHLIYHPSLNSFRTNDAISIAAELDTDVRAAADGVVTSIEESVQTGVTITTAIGNDYYVVYGQLQDSELIKVGDSVCQGEVIGKIAKASRFYSKEGDNLYFQVRCGEETLNPMSLLGRVEETEDVVNDESDAVETTAPEE